MAAGSRISVEITGVSTELKAAVAEAVSALQGLGDALARQTDAAVVAGDRSIRMNDLVAKSFQGMAVEAGAASERTIAAFQRQGAVVLGVADEQVSASERVIRAQEMQAAAAQKSADAQVRANELAATRMSASAKKTEAAFGSASSGLTKAGKTISLGLLGAATASVILASKFQSNTLRMQTQAGATTAQLAKLRQGILQMAQEVGYTPDQLANGMYHVVSSMNAVLPPTKRVVTELSVLRAAAEGAQVGHSNLEETTYALASAMNALHAPGNEAIHIMGQLNAIVGSGDMTMQDLIDAFKSGLVPGARNAGLSLQSVGSAMAVMGDMGMRGALAGTRLRMSIALLSSPSEAAAKVLQTLGMSATQAVSTSAAMSQALADAGLRTTTLSADLRQPDGLMVALHDLNQHLRESGLTATGAAAVMNKAFGGGRMGGTIVTLAENTGRLETKFQQIGNTAGQFGSDWQKASHTTSFELHSLEASVASLGTRLGTDLLPYVNAGVHDLTDFVGWLEKGSSGAHALEIAVGTLAAVTIGSYFTSKIKQAITLTKDFGSALTFLGGRMGIGGAASPAAGAAPAGRGAIGGMPGLPAMGVRSGTGPGSEANPLVVAIMAGEYAGLGSMGAAGTVANDMQAAKSETGAVAAASKGGLLLPAGVTTAEKAASADTALVAAETAGGTAGGTSLLSTVRSGLGGVLSGAVKGVGFAGIAVGLAAALEGGLQMFFSHINDQAAQQFADKLTKDLPAQVSQGTIDGVKRAYTNTDLRKHVVQASQEAAASPPGTRGGQGPGRRPLSPGSDTALQKDYFNEGYTAGKATIQGLQSVKYPSELIFFRDFRTQLEKLPPQARDQAAKMMLQFAEGLQKSGRLPKGSVDAMIGALEADFPGLQSYLRQQGLESADTIAKAMKLSQADANWKQALEHFRSEYGDMAISQNITSQNIVSNTTQAMSDLKVLMTSGPRAQRQAAMAEYNLLQHQVSGTFSAMLSDLQAKQATMTSSIRSGSQQSAQAAITNYGQFAASVQNAMNQGALATSQGTKLIATALDALLKALGAPQIPIAGLTSKQLSSISSFSGVQGYLGGAGTTGLHKGGLDVGGWVGNRGERGTDTVHAVLGRGEAVLNAPQQAIVNNYVPGGLDAVFSATKGTKHWMAAGGYVDPIPGFSLGRSDMGVDANAAPGTPIGAIGDSRLVGVIPDWYQGQPLLDFQLLSGPDKGRYWYVAEQIAPVTEHIGAMFAAGQMVARYASQGTGIEIGWAANASGTTLAQATGQLGTGDHSNAPAGLAFRAFLSGLAHGKITGGLLSELRAPGVKGKGAIADIVRAALASGTSAANSFLAAQTGGVGAPSGKLVPGIMAIAQAAAAAAGVPWNAAIESALLQHESSGGINEPPSGPLGATGPMQIIPGTFRRFEAPGKPNISNPVDSMFAAFRYIKATYGTLENLAASTGLLTGGYHGYSGGGYVYASGGFPSKVLKTSKTKLPKVGSAPKGISTGMTTKDMQELSGVGGQINAIETAIVNLAGRYAADQTLFPPQEGEAQYLNPDGSLTAAGYAKKIADDQTLLGIDQQLLGLYMQEVPIVSSALTKYLGHQRKDDKTIAANKKKIAANKIKEGSIRKAILDLHKPVPNRVKALELTIESVKNQWDGKIHKAETDLQSFSDTQAAQEEGLKQTVLNLEKRSGDPTSKRLAETLLGTEEAKANYKGTDPATKQRLSDAVTRADLTYRAYALNHPSKNPALTAARHALSQYELTSGGSKLWLTEALQNAKDGEFSALSPLKSALIQAKAAQDARKFKIATEDYHLKQELTALTNQDTKLSQLDTNLASILSGAGGAGAAGTAAGVNPTITLLETVASKLGQVNWNGGKFAGIDVTMPGEVVSVQADIQSLTNDIGTAQSNQSGAATAQNSQLTQLLQQENLQLSEALAVSENEAAAILSMIPEIPKYKEGGPVLNDTLAMVHKGEHVVPERGALVLRDGGGSQAHFTVEQHLHGDPAMRALMSLIDQRIRHPDNMRAVSKQFGRRTNMLAGAPGGWR